jgi:hypothetical protein
VEAELDPAKAMEELGEDMATHQETIGSLHEQIADLDAEKVGQGG